jgi:hypothetical protein
MTRYIFSGGKVLIGDGIDLAPEKRSHPLGTTVLLIVEQLGEYNSDQPIHQHGQEAHPDEPASRVSHDQ